MNIVLKLTSILVLLSGYVVAQDDRIKKTDSSIITTKYYEELNSIRVFNQLRSINKSYYTDYYFDNKKIKEHGVFLNDKCSGIWKEYDHNGKTLQVIDYNNGIIKYSDKKSFPSLAFQYKIKLKADSILSTVYSPEFVKKNIVWDIADSYVYNDPISDNWKNGLPITPKEFLLRYKVRFENKLYTI